MTDTGYPPYDLYPSRHGDRPAWAYPPCPTCETDVFVAGIGALRRTRFICYFCKRQFDYDDHYRAQMRNNDNDWECPACGSFDTIAVWDESDPATESPDYIGCKSCNTMTRQKQ